MKLITWSCCVLLCSCQFMTQETNTTSQIKHESWKKHTHDSVLGFSKTLVYEYIQDNMTEQLWFFVNEENGIILYQPQDDMIKAVISYPNGEYITYGLDSHGMYEAIHQKIEIVNELPNNVNLLIAIDKEKKIDQSHVGMKSILSKGYTLKYDETNDRKEIFISEDIPINARQIYGFSALEGDSRLSIDLINYLNVLKKNQIITHVEGPCMKLKLLDYGDNTFYFSLTPFPKK